MALRKIVLQGEPCLTKVCRPVTEFNGRLHTLLDDLKDTLLDSGGVGLAAPQVGILRRVCVVMNEDDEIIEQFGDYNYGWHDTDFAGEAAKKGIDENVVRAISADKHEPEWMLEKRLEGYRDFINRPMPQWGVDLKDFDADDFKYYVKPIDKQATTWEELPDEIRSTYDKLGIPEAEKSRLVSGVAAR